MEFGLKKNRFIMEHVKLLATESIPFTFILFMSEEE